MFLSWSKTWPEHRSPYSLLDKKWSQLTRWKRAASAWVMFSMQISQQDRLYNYILCCAKCAYIKLDGNSQLFHTVRKPSGK